MPKRCNSFISGWCKTLAFHTTQLALTRIVPRPLSAENRGQPLCCAVRAAPPSRHLTSDRSGLLDHVARIGANRVGKVEKFHNVDAPLNALDRGNERLIQF